MNDYCIAAFDVHLREVSLRKREDAVSPSDDVRILLPFGEVAAKRCGESGVGCHEDGLPVSFIFEELEVLRRDLGLLSVGLETLESTALD